MNQQLKFLRGALVLLLPSCGPSEAVQPGEEPNDPMQSSVDQKDNPPPEDMEEHMEEPEPEPEPEPEEETPPEPQTGDRVWQLDESAVKVWYGQAYLDRCTSDESSEVIGGEKYDFSNQCALQAISPDGELGDAIVYQKYNRTSAAMELGPDGSFGFSTKLGFQTYAGPSLLGADPFSAAFVNGEEDHGHLYSASGSLLWHTLCENDIDMRVIPTGDDQALVDLVHDWDLECSGTGVIECRDGDPCRSLFFVAAGKVQAVASAPTNALVGPAPAGGYFEAVRSYDIPSVRVYDDAQELLFEYDELTYPVLQEPKFADGMMAFAGYDPDFHGEGRMVVVDSSSGEELFSMDDLVIDSYGLGGGIVWFSENYIKEATEENMLTKDQLRYRLFGYDVSTGEEIASLDYNYYAEIVMVDAEGRPMISVTEQGTFGDRWVYLVDLVR